MIGRILIVGLVLIAVTAGIALAETRGEPDLRIALPEDTVDPGASTTLSVVVANEGDLENASATNPGHTERVTTARAITVDIDERRAPLTVATGEHLIGSLPAGAATTLPFRVHVDRDAKPGTYEMDVTLAYRYTSRIADNGRTVERDETVERTLAVTVRRTPRFRLVTATGSVRAGESGRVAVTLENDGPVAANQSIVSLESANGDLVFWPQRGVQVALYTGDWAPAERRTLTYNVHAVDAPRNRTYPVRITVDYTDDHGVDRRSPPLHVGVSTRAAPALAIENVSALLRVDDRGAITGTIANVGETPINASAVRIEDTPPGITLRRAVVPTGDLAPGDSAAFRFAVDVAGWVDAGPAEFSLRPTWRSADSTLVQGTPTPVRTTVEPEREPFELSVVNGTVAPDAANYRFTVDLRNVDTAPRRDVIVRLASPPPFTSRTPLMTVSALDTGETVRLTFDLSVDEDAVTGIYPVYVNTTSETPDGKQATDGPYLLTVRVEEQTDGAMDYTVVGGAALLVVVILGAGWLWLRG